MKIVKNKEGYLFLVTDKNDSVLKHTKFYGELIGYEIYIGKLDGVMEKISTPLLEDIFFLAQAELQERDRAEIEKGIRYE